MTVGPDRLSRRIARYAVLANAVLWLEVVSVAFWPAMTLVLAFIALALLGIPQAMPATLHLLFLVATLVVLGLLIRQGLRDLSRPAFQAGIRRVERASGLQHRPFDALSDRPAGQQDPLTLQLWSMHLAQRRTAIRRLRVDAPRPDLPRLDPQAFRLLVFLTLVVGLVVSGPRASHRLATALVPEFSLGDAPIPVEAWVKPPAYTGLPAQIVKADQAEPVTVPTGSTLVLHVTGGSRVPQLKANGTSTPLKELAGNGYSIEYQIAADQSVRVRQGWSTLAHWQFATIPDRPPTVAFVGKPTATESGALRIDYKATDDYGVASVAVRIRLAEDRPDIVADPIESALSSGGTDKESRGSSFQDFTGHQWAGMKVLAKLVATDGAGQSGESPEAAIILPERTFVNKAAQAIVATRKHIILNDEPKFQTIGRLAQLAAHPEAYGGDYGVFLGLDAALLEFRAARQGEREAILRVEDLLWNAALKIEDGNRPDAERDLRAAEEELERALKDPNTSASEIARLTQKLKDAMNRDIEAMAQNLQRQMQQGDQSAQQSDPNSQTMDRNELNQQVDKMNQLAQQGSRDAAQDMLDYIKSLLENMKAAQQSAQSTEQGRKAMQKLKDLANKQRDLENSDSEDSAQQQEALRQSLGDAAREIGDSMGDIPKSMSNADKAMRNAGKALQRGVRGGAKAAQEEAAGQLDDAAQSIADQMSKMDSDRKGDGSGNRDPFGRARFDTGKDVRVPTEREMQHSREILDELRRRAGQRERPRQELDYLKRLLQQY